MLRNPGLTAKTAVTVDHISGGRTWLGVGAAWFDYEHAAHGIDFGRSMGQRLDWMEESVDTIERLTRGGRVTSAPEDAYAFQDLQHRPPPYRGSDGWRPGLPGSPPRGERGVLRLGTDTGATGVAFASRPGSAVVLADILDRVLAER